MSDIEKQVIEPGEESRVASMANALAENPQALCVGGMDLGEALSAWANGIALIALKYDMTRDEAHRLFKAIYETMVEVYEMNEPGGHS